MNIRQLSSHILNQLSFDYDSCFILFIMTMDARFMFVYIFLFLFWKWVEATIFILLLWKTALEPALERLE